MGLLSTVGNERRKMPRRTLLYAVHGWGKSTWAAGAPGHIFIPTEDGLEDIPNCARFFHGRNPPKCESFKEFVQCLFELYEDKSGQFTQVVIDTADWLERLIWADVAERRGVANIADIDFQRGYEFALVQWREIIAGLDALRNEKGMAVTLLAHCKVEKFQNPETETYDRYSPRLHKWASALLQEWCDEVLFGTYEVFTKSTDEGFNKTRAQGIGTGQRIIRTCERPAHVAKNRLGLPSQIAGDYNSYAHYLSA